MLADNIDSGRKTGKNRISAIPKRHRGEVRKQELLGGTPYGTRKNDYCRVSGCGNLEKVRVNKKNEYRLIY